MTRNMTFFTIIFFLLCTILPAQTDYSIGMNLAELNYWSTDWVFVDRMKNAREWVTSSIYTDEWNTDIDIPSDGNGYPMEVPFDPDGSGPIEPQKVKTLLFNSSFYPEGTYTLMFEGTGEIRLSLDAKGTFIDSSISHNFEISEASSGIMLSIESSSSTDPIRNIRVIMPGFEDSYSTQIFHPLFLERLELFSTIRFNRIGRVWGSEVQEWSEVIGPDHYTQTVDSGIAPEYMIALSNRLSADAWICIPHQADDNYVQQLADLIFENLNSENKLYIEYGNEVWNPMKSDIDYVQAKGTALGLSGNTFQAGVYYYARRSAEIFTIFENTFGGTERLIRVIGGQGANSWVGETALEGLSNHSINPTSSRADALAIAPYFGGDIADEIVDNGEVSSISIDKILNRAELSILERTANWTWNNYLVSKEHDVDLIAYEGGSHLVGSTNANRDNVQLTEKLIEANRDERMYDLFLQMFNVWFSNGGKLFVGFLYVEVPSKYGSWGILEYQNQSLSEAPKYRAYNDVISSSGEALNRLSPLSPYNIKVK